MGQEQRFLSFMKITILHGTMARDTSFKVVWGISYLVEASGKTILFDTDKEGNITSLRNGITGIGPGKAVSMNFLQYHQILYAF
jgi:hypothetical protein